MDRDIVVRARAGDRDAFSMLATASIGRLNAVARLIVRDDGRAEDAVQDALVDAWLDLPALRDPDRFDAWLNRLLINACHNVTTALRPPMAGRSAAAADRFTRRSLIPKPRMPSPTRSNAASAV